MRLRLVEAAREHVAQVHVALARLPQRRLARLPQAHEAVLARGGEQAGVGLVHGDGGARALVHLLAQHGRVGAADVEAQQLALLGGAVEAVGVGGVPRGALRLGGQPQPGAVVGRAAVGDGADAVVGGGEQHVGLHGVELHHRDLVLVEVQRHHALLRGHVPQLHRGVRAARRQHVAVLAVPRQAHHRLPVAARLQRALLVVH